MARPRIATKKHVKRDKKGRVDVKEFLAAKSKPSKKDLKLAAEARIKKANPKHEPVETPNFTPTPRDGEKSGQFIQRVLELSAFTTEEIVILVKDNFPNSKVKPADVSFHRTRLRKAGTDFKVVFTNKAGDRYSIAA